MDIPMKVIVQIAAADDAKAWAILVRHSPGVALPHRTFILSEAAVYALAVAGIRFTELSRANEVSHREGAVAGKRI
jgi:hypothetical protein